MTKWLFYDVQYLPQTNTPEMLAICYCKLFLLRMGNCVWTLEPATAEEVYSQTLNTLI